MRCVICKHGETCQGSAAVTLERGGVTLVFKHVPAEVCGNCGEEYVDADTSARLLRMLDDAVKTGVMVDVREYAVA